ncbi:hypothetical protein BC834DRAFT_926935 [Gloeopeniophorella convolvens]|nr:hypothetical protein BC834DRAFT_926935 [Gloeopeniophorella convolvens]
MDEEQALEALSNVITALAEAPYDLALHAQHIQLAAAAHMDDQVLAARETLAGYYACADDVWIPLIEAKRASVDVDTVEGALAVLEVYGRAEEDYLSIPLLKQHMDFLIDRHADFAASGGVAKGSEEPFSREWTRGALRAVVARGTGHLTQSYLLWDALRDWEVEGLAEIQGEERPAAIVEVEDMFLARLQQCHSTNDDTFNAYSSFTTNYKASGAYETLLVNATKVRAGAKKAYGWREPYEAALEKSGNSLYAYQNYIAYEHRAKQPDLIILSNIHERAIAEAAKRRSAGEAGAEEALRLWWASYVDGMRRNDAPLEQQLSLYQRAVRSVPGNGDIWAKYMRFLEVNNELVEDGSAQPISALYDKAISTKLFEKDIEQMMPLFLARSGFERRICVAALAGEQSAESALAHGILTDGIKTSRAADKNGDTRFRLERFLFTLYNELGQPDDAAKVWSDATKHYRNAYIPGSNTPARSRNDAEARRAFARAARAPLDWPEMLWEAWLAFEHSNGSAADIQDALDVVERARAQEAQKAGYQAMQVAAEQQAAQVPVADAVAAASEVSAAGDVAMDVDAPAPDAPSGSGVKRKAEDAPAEESKKAKIEPPQPLKRDRENCTVFVGELPSGTTDDELTQLFKDCGAIREIKITQLPNMLVATVEFAARDSVPAALTKDKKRVRGQEIAVHLAWESTLYVTNFPESMDDEALRKLFAQYGHIFDVRWPSKKFKSTRRFCYVQYTAPTAAKLALELHGRELEPGHSLNVYVSNPERRKERTDADANAREVYVAGLSRFATKEDLEKLFRTYGPVKEVRMALDDGGLSKGFAFVEFEEEKDATKALGANNYELKKRRIAVTLSDTRVRSRKREPDSGLGKKADARSRTLRIRDLPPGTQEGLLQQAVERLAPVRRVEVRGATNEARVEFANAADAARLLLLPDPLELAAPSLGSRRARTLLRQGAAGVSTGGGEGGLFIPRSAATRPRAGLGKARAPAAAAAAPIAGSPTSASGEKAQASAQGKGQDDFRKMLLGGK